MISAELQQLGKIEKDIDVLQEQIENFLAMSNLMLKMRGAK